MRSAISSKGVAATTRVELDAGISKVRKTVIILSICLAALFALCGCSKPKGNIAFVGKPASSGSSFVFTLTNSGDAAVSYLACLPQMQSGGAWSNVQWPASPAPMMTLFPKQSSEVTVAAPVDGAPWRLPVLWGTVQSPPLWKRVELATQTFFTGHNDGVRGPLYTNFSTEVSP